MAITIRFRLRSSQKDSVKPRLIYVRLTVNGRTPTDYPSGLSIRPDMWDGKSSRAKGYSALAKEINARLLDVEAMHLRILSELERLHQSGVLPHLPSADDVRTHFLSGGSLVPGIEAVYDQYVTYLRSLDGTPAQRHPRTLEKWALGRKYLTEYVSKSRTGRLSVDQLTIGWAEGFYRAGLKRGLGLATAARFVGYVRASINHLVKNGQLARNPLEHYFPDKGKDKPVYFMEQTHLTKLWNLEVSGTAAVARDWLLLMCYTGMDQGDLVTYLNDRDGYEQATSAGTLIVIPRGKTGLSANIPLLFEVDAIMRRYPSGLPYLTNQSLNRFGLTFESQIGFPHRLTTKICRKTAGAVFLLAQYSIAEVSGILGHASTQTTLRNYVKITTEMVSNGMRRIASKGKAFNV